MSTSTPDECAGADEEEEIAAMLRACRYNTETGDWDDDDAHGSHNDVEPKAEDDATPLTVLDWVPPQTGQNYALLAFATPTHSEQETWAWMFMGAYDTVAAAEAVQEDLFERQDDRFVTMVCDMRVLGHLPPARDEYRGRVRYMDQGAQSLHDAQLDAKVKTARARRQFAEADA